MALTCSLQGLKCQKKPTGAPRRLLVEGERGVSETPWLLPRGVLISAKIKIVGSRIQ
jgi:hypothetical protein